MINKVTLLGRLGKDPETRYTGSGMAVANFSLATSEKRKDDNGEFVEKTEWHNIVVWGKQAENCQQYLTKGRQVYIEGKIQTRNWENDAGVKQYKTEIVAFQIKYLGNNNDQQTNQQHNQQQNNYQGQQNNQQRQQQNNNNEPNFKGSDDNIPF